MHRGLQTILLTLVGLIALLIIYAASYFVVMEEGDTFNASTLEREYRSYCRFTSIQRVPGDLSIYFSPTHWTNRFYYPMDRLMGRPHHRSGR